MVSNTTARPRCLSRCGDAAAGLMMAPPGASEPRSTEIPPRPAAGCVRGVITSGSQILASSR